MRNMEAAIFLVSSHSTIVLLGADRHIREILDILFTGIFIRVFCVNVQNSPINHGKLQFM